MPKMLDSHMKSLAGEYDAFNERLFLVFSFFILALAFFYQSAIFFSENVVIWAVPHI